MTSQNTRERREHPRFTIASNMHIYTFGGLAQLSDISAGGFCVEYLDGGLELYDDYITNFLVCYDNYCIRNLSIKIAWTGPPRIYPNSLIVYQPVGAKFHNLTPAKQQHLEQFINYYCKKELLI